MLEVVSEKSSLYEVFILSFLKGDVSINCHASASLPFVCQLCKNGLVLVPKFVARYS
jgi:hypothetical protein